MMKNGNGGSTRSELVASGSGAPIIPTTKKDSAGALQCAAYASAGDVARWKTRRVTARVRRNGGLTQSAPQLT